MYCFISKIGQTCTHTLFKQWGFTQHSQGYIQYIHIWKPPSESFYGPLSSYTGVKCLAQSLMTDIHLPCPLSCDRNTNKHVNTNLHSIFTYSIVCVMLRMPCTHAHTVKETHPSTEPTIWISSWICQLPAQARVSQLYCTAGGLRFKQQQQLSPPVEQERVTLTGLQQAELQSNL